ncbi:MAG: Hsp20/alpha crystallin family protein [Firmicutes bacterium]|nr:Hsp20/alpha crystallin family protein [Bacillota bacterium]
MEIRQISVNPLVAGTMTTGVLNWAAPTTAIPRVDIIDTGDEIIYLMDVAGADPDNLVLEISPAEVAIIGPLSQKIPQGALIYAERPRGSYTRILALPREADSERASADFTNGVLIVRFPKKNKSMA